MRTQKTNILFGAIAVIAAVLLVAALSKDTVKSGNDKAFESFVATQQEDVTVSVSLVSAGRDGVHFEGGGTESLAWGPKTFSVEDDGTVWIDDTPSQRRIRVGADGSVLEVKQSAKQPVEVFAEDQELSAELEVVRSRLGQSSLYEGFEVSSSEVRYWGTSPEGIQYWQTTETRQDGSGVLRVRTFLHALDASGERVALAELPVSSQYTYVFNGGAFVDAERDAAYFMATSPKGVRIQSVDWAKVK